jgi:hypothetical protein
MKTREAPEAATFARIRRQVRREMEAPRSLPWWADSLSIGAVSLATTTAATVLGVRGGASHEVSPLTALALLAAIFFGAIGAIQPGATPLRLATLLLLAGAALAVVWSGDRSRLSSPRDDLGCLVSTCILGAVPAAMALASLRRFALDETRALVGVGGATAAAVLALHVDCPYGSIWHLAGFHVLPWVALITLGLAIRRRLPSGTFVP